MGCAFRSGSPPGDPAAPAPTPPATAPSIAGDEAAQEVPITPGGAFLRSVLVPGWGHIATDSYGRAGFYVTMQSASLWMLWQTMDRRGEARAFERLERDLAAERLRSGGMSDPDSIQIAVDRDPAVQDREALVEARGAQVEDWSALSIFLVLLGATDAFVAAHLADYPEPLALDVLPLGGGRVEVRGSIPWSAIRERLDWRP